jgi:hypothetical protein
VPQFFSPDASGGSAPLTPVVYGAANVRFVEPKFNVDVSKLVTWTAAVSDGAVAVDWDNATAVDLAPELLERDAPEGAGYGDVPAPALKAKNYDAWGKQFIAAVLARESLDLLHSPGTDEISHPDESERDFRARLQQSAREKRDRTLDALRKKYAPRQAALDERLRRAQQVVTRESEQATGQKLQTAISVGATLVSMFMGRKAVSAGSIGRATTAARGLGRTMKESEDISRAQQDVAAIQQQQQALDDELKAESASLEAAADPATETFEKVSIKPKRANVALKLAALVWVKGS